MAKRKKRNSGAHLATFQDVMQLPDTLLGDLVRADEDPVIEGIPHSQHSKNATNFAR